ncbi:MAG: GTPase HflX [Chitinispirillaceae bacterium]|nr:GTPase HflX [Chitinispirillaceae bacterium]
MPIPHADEKVVLAGLLLSGDDEQLFEEDMQEMQLLCATAGARVVERIIQRRESPVASTFMGRGKLQEIKTLMRVKGADTLVIDGRLSPGQVRNIEEIVEAKVIDRGQLILDIFAKHARTNEARVQVELAQMRTLYPRLTHAWTHFSQQVGGIGTVGPGEKQLEVDRRVVKKKIADLEKRLEKIEREREEQRKSRKNIFRVSLVGYTNVGKSSLLNGLCGSEVPVEDQLFATLDTATRRSYIAGVGEIVISDTVGFLRKLPHDLVASFRSTLSEVTESHLLLIVMDASSRWIDQQHETVLAVLSTLGAQSIPRLQVLNKCDLVQDPFTRKKIGIDYPDALFVSAFEKEDIRLLKERIASAVLSFDREKKVTDIILQKTRSVARDRAALSPQREGTSSAP